MLSRPRGPRPITFKALPSPPSPFFGKRATFAVVVDASNPPVDRPPKAHRAHYPPLTIYPFKKIGPPTADVQQATPLPVYDVGGDADNGSTTNTDSATDHPSVVPNPCFRTSSFPVYGPFDLLCRIREGGFGIVWAARDQSTGRLLCLKAFLTLRNPEVVHSVRTELKMFRRMVKSREGERGKQFLIELNRSIQHDTIVFFAMELMSFDLWTYLVTEPERCEAHARRWTAQIALGIESLHEMGILHRDIKSENILIDSRENIRIIDFGLAYLDPYGEPLHRGVSYAMDFVGTVPYMAPEVLRNKEMPFHRKKFYGTAVDWWGLGCILFELESRQHEPLFNTEDDVHTYVAWTRRPDQLDQVYSKFEGLESDVLDLVDGLLQSHPVMRYSFDDLETHNYFQHHDGSEFDNAAARALERPVRTELVPQFTEDHEPAGVIEAAKPGLIYDWTNLNWGLQM